MHRRRHLIPALIVTAGLLVSACASSAGGPVWTVAPISSAPTAARPSGSPSAPPSGAPTAPSPTTEPVGSGEFSIEAFDLGFTPAMVTVAAAGSYSVSFHNAGAIGHDITFDDGTVIVAAAGETKTGTVVIPDSGLGFICSVPGHAAAGMAGAVMVDGTAVGPTPSASASAPPDDHGGPPPAVAGVEPDPAAPAYLPYDATAPTLLPGTTHDIDLVMTEGLMTVAPGYVVDAWTFGGTVPGPVIRVKVGDLVRIHLKNPATNQLSHSIDFHASQVAWNDEMTSIAPGEEKLYEWTASYAGVWMYHCGTAPALHHIANGMFGMVIVEPAEGLPPIDAEFAIVQSEWYMDAQGTPASLTKAAAGAPAPDFVVFNGVANQYKDHPLVVGTGERVRFFVLDAGPDIDSSFHIVGTIFDSVVKEGMQLAPANAASWGSQAVDLSPAQGAIIELTTPEDGLYPIVTHAFNFVGLGALGLLQAGDGDPLN